VRPDHVGEQCPVCGTRAADDMHIARCRYRDALRVDLRSRAGRSGIPAVSADDLFAHLANIYEDSSLAHRAAANAIDLGWRPVVGSNPDRLWTAPTEATP
jgi:hypothetical protein